MRSLLTEQHEDLAHLELREVGEGWDNKLFGLGSDLAVRLPRRAISAPPIDPVRPGWLRRHKRFRLLCTALVAVAMIADPPASTQQNVVRKTALVTRDAFDAVDDRV